MVHAFEKVIGSSIVTWSSRVSGPVRRMRSTRWSSSLWGITPRILPSSISATVSTVIMQPAHGYMEVANLPALARAIPFLAEVSIGHGLAADALEYGMAETVRRFLKAAGW